MDERMLIARRYGQRWKKKAAKLRKTKSLHNVREGGRHGLVSHSSHKSLSMLKEQISHAHDASKALLPSSPMERAKKRSERHKLLKTSVSARALLQFQNGSKSSLNVNEESFQSASGAGTNTAAVGHPSVDHMNTISHIDSAKKLDTILRGELELKKRLGDIENMLRNLQPQNASGMGYANQPSKPLKPSRGSSNSSNGRGSTGNNSSLAKRPPVVGLNHRLEEKDREYSSQSITERLQKYKSVAKRPELQRFLKENNL
jgi:hypothetical protein